MLEGRVDAEPVYSSLQDTFLSRCFPIGKSEVAGEFISFDSINPINAWVGNWHISLTCFEKMCIDR